MGKLVSGSRLECMGERVAVVEDGPATRFALVGPDDLCLDRCAPSDALGEGKPEQVVSGEEVVLRHLPHAAACLPRWQRREGIEVAQHGAGLPEGTHEILALREVHPGLAADRGVDHREQARCNMNDGDTAMEHRGGKPGDVGNETATDPDHAV
ncbi:unannotated protein [freshwater metagenome]|uniref:Unannotated protein n=1 Tax=freshwater metagenome TaxID=449393 RepID=A0A6J7MJX7_9ZZZZ